jgi:hypothetical protein
MSEESARPRGVVAWIMPESVTGPDQYALVIRDKSEGLEARMVHTEGVAYLVTSEKPWTWNDYDPNCPKFSIDDLVKIASSAKGIDLADWVRSFGHRLESNFFQVYAWANEES